MGKKKIVAMADLHCGHRVGLTPPKWQGRNVNPKYNRIQKELWDFYIENIQTFKPNILFVVGDAIDGKGEKSGGTEQITTDRGEQSDMAAECILAAGANEIIMTYGTAYHTGYHEDWEDQVAQKVKAKSIRSQQWIDVNGVVFDLKHHIGRSSIPHGKGTPIAKDKLWNMVWSEFEEQPKADVVIRAHVHAHDYIGSSVKWLAMTLPALQGQGSKFGSRIPSGHVDFGFVRFVVNEDGGYVWRASILVAKSQKRAALKL